MQALNFTHPLPGFLYMPVKNFTKLSLSLTGPNVSVFSEVFAKESFYFYCYNQKERGK